MGLQTGPDIEDMIKRPVVVALVCVMLSLGAMAAGRVDSEDPTPFVNGMQDGPDGVDPLGRSGGYHSYGTATFGGTGFIDLGTATPRVDRRCSLPGEMQACEGYCAGIGGPSKPESGWDPPTTASRGTTTNPFRTYQMVNSCDVRTIGSALTLVCTCFDPSNRT
jgi:hypothetical protein